jgi:hypothetical protein
MKQRGNPTLDISYSVNRADGGVPSPRIQSAKLRVNLGD